MSLSISVEQVLELPTVKRGVPEVIAGAVNLGNPVRWVHAGEAPYIGALLQGGELLLTGGRSIGPSRRDEEHLVESLVERGAAGLVIELGSRFRSSPKLLGAAAERAGLPVIVLHREVPFIAIAETVNRDIVHREAALALHTADIRAQATRLLIDGAGVGELLALLSATIGNPAILELASGGVAFQITHRASDREVSAAWDTFRRQLPGAPDAAVHAIVSERRGEWGRLVALAVDAPLADADRLAVDSIGQLLAVELMRGREPASFAARRRSDFIADLLSGDVDSAEAAVRASALGFKQPVRGLMPVVVVPQERTDAAPPTPSMRDAPWDLVWRDVRDALEREAAQVLLGHHRYGEHMLIVLGLRDTEERATLAGRLAEVLRTSTLARVPGAPPLVVCAGPSTHSWDALRAALHATIDAATPTSRSEARPWHDVTVPNVDRLIWSLRDRPELMQFATARLHPLLQRDRERTTRMLPTLETLCRHGGRKADAARELHIERQSLYSRLARIGELMDADLSDPDTLAAIQLALRIRTVLGERG
ncbi:PucR family transcriptional regulator [Conexibacter sp. CPCC 206217]|uniref:PucR family transcriptional regulator n=1 Tax=Conexibacter sp. CPCC 206217 TaxID=3064574 RepID=UPI00271AC036|nr:PucR family transcriptional regulator [Conexibacter sp. CPCC 206217]MDO8212068.1 PucR family transcriptional regulator [Conexibacter sp. CPCC 206217]